jgi:hypothetical protein
MDGSPWWVAKDVGAVLGYSNPQKATRDHCKNARPVGVNESFTLDPQTVIIPEPDLYRLIAGSRLPAAVRFEKWVFEEVLPSIRKTGAYGRTARLDAEYIGMIVRETVRAVLSETHPAPAPESYESEFDKPITRDRRLLSGYEVSALLGITRGVLYTWRKSGKLRPMFPTGPLVYSAKDAFALLDSQTATAACMPLSGYTQRRPTYETGVKKIKKALLNPPHAGHIAILLGMTADELKYICKTIGLGARTVFTYEEALRAWKYANGREWT